MSLARLFKRKKAPERPALRAVPSAPSTPSEVAATPGPASGLFGSATLHAASQVLRLVQERVRNVIETSEREVLAAGDALQALADEGRAQAQLLRQIGTEIGDRSGLSEALASQRETAKAFAREIERRAAAQQDLTEAAAERSRRIVDAGDRIHRIAKNSRLLSFNAQMEASRLGSQGRAFAIIAQEVRELAAEVDKTNALIAELAEDVSRQMPELARTAQELAAQASEFGLALESGLHEVDAAQAQQRQRFARAVVDSEKHSAEMVRISHDALQHLQFQDPASQALRQTDQLLVKVSAALQGSSDDSHADLLRSIEGQVLSADTPASHRNPLDGTVRRSQPRPTESESGERVSAPDAPDAEPSEGEPLDAGEVLLF